MQQTEKNPLFDLAVNYTNQTMCSLFVTGKAGTGKTTFLRHIAQTSLKKSVIVAPTGVAAINAGGVTIHSLFQLPFGLFLPDYTHASHTAHSFSVNNRYTLLQNARIGKSKRKLLQEIDLLIIDEVSMVKADTMDAIDTMLRHVRNRHYEPFGGVQLLCIGDLFQLPPVVRDEEWQLMKQVYKSPFFFDSKVFEQINLVCIEFDKIYRQSNFEYIELLNKIRENRAEESDLDQLNREHFNPDFTPPEDKSYITLCSHNYLADEINQEKLEELPSEEQKFEAEVTGDFNENAYPTSKTLRLKKGAQVMFVKNDAGNERRYYNGKIGRIENIAEGEIWVKFENESELLLLEKVEWENIRYNFNDKNKKIEEQRLGSFKQFPIKLAWAVTIHKSQGLTFERAIVDAGSSFSDGQVYVALSRLTSPEGLVLKTRIYSNSILCSDEVIAFMSQTASAEKLASLLPQQQKEYIKHLIADSFYWGKLEELFTGYRTELEETKVPDRVLTERYARKWAAQMTEQNRIAIKFADTLKTLLPEAEKDNYAFLSQRVAAAAMYFTKALNDEILQPLTQYKSEVSGHTLTKKFQQLLFTLQEEAELKSKLLKTTQSLVSGLAEKRSSQELLDNYYNALAQANKEVAKVLPAVKVQKAEKGSSQKESLALFKSGKSMEEIAAHRNLAQSTIEGHLATFVITGELSVFELMEKEKLMKALEVIKTNPEKTMGEIKQSLGEEYSFAELRFVSNYWKYISRLQKEASSD